MQNNVYHLVSSSVASHENIAHVVQFSKLVSNLSEVNDYGPITWAKYQSICVSKHKTRNMLLQTNALIKYGKVELVTCSPTYKGFIQSRIDCFSSEFFDDTFDEFIKEHNKYNPMTFPEPQKNNIVLWDFCK